ncbi:SDR family oxidoreductase, partial [Mesorhizobium sp. M7A.T.Ca.TU.009.01.3.2]
PGWVRTEASMRSLGRMAEQGGVSEAALLEDIVGAQALPGLMEPADMAGTYLFLASDLAANITGQSLGVDRGEVPW